MRFGKTFTAYELAKIMNLKRVLILTFKPAVEESWETDLNTHVDFEGWQFYSRDLSWRTGVKPEDMNPDKPIVCFGSFQDFLGTNVAGGIKVKNEWVHTTNWDLVILMNIISVPGAKMQRSFLKTKMMIAMMNLILKI